MWPIGRFAAAAHRIDQAEQAAGDADLVVVPLDAAPLS